MERPRRGAQARPSPSAPRVHLKTAAFRYTQSRGRISWQQVISLHAASSVVHHWKCLPGLLPRAFARCCGAGPPNRHSCAGTKALGYMRPQGQVLYRAALINASWVLSVSISENFELPGQPVNPETGEAVPASSYARLVRKTHGTRRENPLAIRRSPSHCVRAQRLGGICWLSGSVPVSGCRVLL